MSQFARKFDKIPSFANKGEYFDIQERTLAMYELQLSLLSLPEKILAKCLKRKW